MLKQEQDKGRDGRNESMTRSRIDKFIMEQEGLRSLSRREIEAEPPSGGGEKTGRFLSESAGTAEQSCGDGDAALYHR